MSSRRHRAGAHRNTNITIVRYVPNSQGRWQRPKQRVLSLWKMHCSVAIKISEFCKWWERHNSHHVIHATLWWRQDKHRRCVGSVALLSVLGGRRVAGRVWINPRSKGYFQWAYICWIPIWQGGAYFICKITVVIGSWLITPHHAKLCEALWKWPIAIW